VVCTGIADRDRVRAAAPAARTTQAGRTHLWLVPFATTAIARIRIDDEVGLPEDFESRLAAVRRRREFKLLGRESG
jgi:hypothetical protein